MRWKSDLILAIQGLARIILVLSLILSFIIPKKLYSQPLAIESGMDYINLMPAALTAAGMAAATIQKNSKSNDLSENAAIEAFKGISKMADHVLIEARIYQEFRLHQKQNSHFPVSFAYGQFGGTLTNIEKAIVGKKILETTQLESGADQGRVIEYVFFTIPSRKREAINFKLEFEKQINMKLKEGEPRKSVLIVEVPERYEQQLRADMSESVKKELGEWSEDKRTKFQKIIQSPITAFDKVASGGKRVFDAAKITEWQFKKSTTEDMNSAAKWGFITAGVYSGMFVYFGVDAAMGTAIMLYSSIMSYFFTRQAEKIANLYRTDILRDFRVAGQVNFNGRIISGETRRTMEQLMTTTAVSHYGGYHLGHYAHEGEFGLTAAQVNGNIIAQYGQAALNDARIETLTPQASRRILDYILWTNMIFRSLLMAGVTLYAFPQVSFGEVMGHHVAIAFTGMQMVVIGVNLAARQWLLSNRRLFEKLGNEGLMKLTYSALRKLLKETTLKVDQKVKQDRINERRSRELEHIKLNLDQHVIRLDKTEITTQELPFIFKVGDKYVTSNQPNICQMLFAK